MDHRRAANRIDLTGIPTESRVQKAWREGGQTAESVADGLDLGTIEPTPILDGCRP